MAPRFWLVQPCSGEGYQAIERPAEHMDGGGEGVRLGGWQRLLGMELVIPDRQAVCGMLTARGVREGKESDRTGIIPTVTQHSSEPSSLAYRLDSLWEPACH